MFPGYFMVANGEKEENFYMCPGSHYYFHYKQQQKVILIRTLQMESFVVPPYPLFVGNVYLQHASAVYLFHPNLGFHVCFVPKYTNLPDAIEFNYGGSFANNKIVRFY